MEALIQQFPNQLKKALEIGRNATLNNKFEGITEVLVTGLGGSGIGGNVVQSYVSDKLSVPFNVTKGYFIPEYVNENTLILVCSYSGNTEETLSALNLGLERGAKVAAVTSGGQLKEIAKEKGFDYIEIPGGMPPRACLGYSFIQQLFILKHQGLLDTDFEAEIEESITLLEQEQEAIKAETKEWASKLHDKLPILYSLGPLEPIAIRWRQQINENSKMLCWHHTIPEMNHNELVGWRVEDNNFAVIVLRTKDDYQKNVTRLNINKTVFEQYTKDIYEVMAKGQSTLAQWMYLNHFGDWLSLYMAYERNMDPTEIEVINFLKKTLAETE